jgi:hypothetical protein
MSEPDQRLLLDYRKYAELFAFCVPKRLIDHKNTIAESGVV